MASPSNAQQNPKIACVVCRQRKVACDRHRPTCGFCAKNGFDCEYVSTSRQPGLRAGYVSRLAQRVSELENRIEEIEDWKNRSGTEAASERRAPTNATRSLNSHVATRPSNTPHELLARTESRSGMSSIATIAETTPNYTTATPNNSSHLEAVGYRGDVSVEHHGSLNRGISTDYAMATPTDSPYPNVSRGPGSLQITSGSTLPIDHISSATVTELCSIWFERYHPWFPILHQPSLIEAIESSQDIESSGRALIVKAISAATVRESNAYASTQTQESISESLRQSVIQDALSDSSLRSIQALLIISIIDYGAGRIIEFWNMMALCKRIGDQLGLRNIVTDGSDFSNDSETVSPRQLPVNNTVIHREEQVRAYWMTEMLDSISTLGTTWNKSILPPLSNSSLPCSDSLWAFPEYIINVWSFGQFRYSSAFSLCIILGAIELHPLHDFLHQPIDFNDRYQRLLWQSEAQRMDERLTNWREEFVASVFRVINAEFAQEERSEMEPNIVLTNCVLNMALIVLFQQLGPFPPGVETTCEPWPYAINRCVYACENMAAKVRRMSDADFAIMNPFLIPCLFVSARFLIVWSKALDADVPRHLHTLAYALHTCGGRWPLANKYEAVIRAAVAEHRTPILQSSLPTQFFDLRHSSLDIDTTIDAWFQGFNSLQRMENN